MLTVPAEMIITGVLAFLVGVAIGWLIWGRALAKSQRVAFELAQVQSSVADASSNRVRLERELAASRDQVKPLADEVDRLRRDLARAQRSEPRVEAVRAEPGVISSDPVARVPAAVPSPGVSPADDLGDLRLLKGVGDKMASRLLAAGVPDTRTLAGLSVSESARVDAELGPFAGRIARDQLVDQARLLAEGRVTEFEARYGRLERPV